LISVCGWSPLYVRKIGARCRYIRDVFRTSRDFYNRLADSFPLFSAQNFFLRWLKSFRRVARIKYTVEAFKKMFFQLKENNTIVRTEIIAGRPTFGMISLFFLAEFLV